MTDLSHHQKAPLTPRQRRFVERYCVHLNATKAAIEAGYSAKTANEQGPRLLVNVRVAEEIRIHQKMLADASFVGAVHVLRDLVAIAFADPRELTMLKRESCRHCHGFGHAYQWIDDAEFTKAMVRFRREVATLPEDARGAAEEDAPDAVGGFGFDPAREPHPNCPRCRGEGVEIIWRADISRLTGPAARLFAGVKETRYGVQILMRDQDRALELLGKHLGMFAQDVNLKNDPENPIALLIAQAQGTALKPVLNPTENDDD